MHVTAGLGLLGCLALGCGDGEETPGSARIGHDTYTVSAVEAQAFDGDGFADLRLGVKTGPSDRQPFLRLDIRFGVLIPGTYEIFGDAQLGRVDDWSGFFALETPLPCQPVAGSKWASVLVLEHACLAVLPHAHGLASPDGSIIKQRVAGHVRIEDIQGDMVRGEVLLWAVTLDVEGEDPRGLADSPFHSGGLLVDVPFVAELTLGAEGPSRD